jgi:hypothetical protein
MPPDGRRRRRRERRGLRPELLLLRSLLDLRQIFFQWKLHLAYHDAQYADLYEQTMYNAVYGSMDLPGKHFYYDNPLDESTARYPWHNCPCCVGNIARTMLMLPTWAYSRSADAVYVNLFAGLRASLGEVAGTEVEIVQETNYPWDGTVKLIVNPKAPEASDVAVRGTWSRRLSSVIVAPGITPRLVSVSAPRISPGAGSCRMATMPAARTHANPSARPTANRA